MAFSLSIFLTLLIGMIQVLLALYSYTFVSEAAREATRYAAVRGSNSCNIAKTFPNCNLGPTSAGNPLQAYVNSLGYPGLNASNITVTATWQAASLNANQTSTVWTTQCAGATDTFNNFCNQPGNQVTVGVQYAFPWAIPGLPNSTLNVKSTSALIINE
jgi:hypothetical protein